jgi:hypothetical protein
MLLVRCVQIIRPHIHIFFLQTGIYIYMNVSVLYKIQIWFLIAKFNELMKHLTWRHSWHKGFHWNPMRQLQESIGIRCWSVASRTVRLWHPLALQIPIIRLRIGTPDSKNPTMSILYTYCSSPYSKLQSGGEQVLSKWEPVLLSKILTLKNHKTSTSI